ncbi:MAG: Gx transporter family protein [Clostridia bacterium]|nr:Gx transporter family protein [Clostridia bacterium]MBP5593585.1 Gx transporter family protein [Clostridia bacterium]MBP5648741.1 Gx transporter family protein [Clostridia bacterium]
MLRKFVAKRIVVDAVLAALSLAIFVAESMLPPLFLPGAKLGLANIFSLFALLNFGFFDALAILLVRILLGSLFSGAFSTILYSIPAGLISLIISYALIIFIYPRVSIVSISVASAVIHNIVQVLVFVSLNRAAQMLGYMPLLALIGAGSGLLIGIIVFLLDAHLPKNIIAIKERTS